MGPFSAILSLLVNPGGVTFSYLVIIKSMTHTYTFLGSLTLGVKTLTGWMTTKNTNPVSLGVVKLS